MTKRPSHRDITAGVLGASFIAISAALPPTVGQAMVGIGVEVLGGLTERGLGRLSAKFSSGDVLLNIELQAAMRRAYVRAIDQLELMWWQTPPGDCMKRGQREDREAVEGLFRMLREDSEQILVDEYLQALVGNAEILEAFGTPEPARRSLEQYLDSYLYGHEEQLSGLIRGNLEPLLVRSFAQELLAQTDEGNRAWRAYQKLSLASLLIGVGGLKSQQREIRALLQGWEERIAALGPEEREATGQGGLVQAVHEAGAMIVSAVAAQFEQSQGETRSWLETTSMAITSEAEQTRAQGRAQHDLTRAEVHQTGDRLSTELQHVFEDLHVDIAQLHELVQDEPARSVHGEDSPEISRLKIFRVSQRPNQFLVGRDSILMNLEDRLKNPGPPPPVITLYGLGGVGKSQVAIAYAYRRAGDIPIIWWMPSSDPTVLAEDFRMLARSLRLPEADAEEIHDTIAAVKSWLSRSNEPWLLVFDNAESEESIRPYLPELGNGQIIVTSRSPLFSNLGVQLRVDPLSQDQGVEYLSRRTGSDDDLAARELTSELGGLPLALVQAGAYIQEKQVSVRQYLGIYAEHRLRLLEEGRPEIDYPDTVATTWEVSFREIERMSAAAADLLRLCSFLAPDGIPLEIIVEQRELLQNDLSQALKNELTTLAIVSALFRYSLIDVIDDQTVSIHRLVQAVVRDRLSERDRAYAALSAINLVFKAFPRDGGDSRTWIRCERLIAHGLEASARAVENGVAPDGAAHVLGSIARYLRARARFEEAEVLLKRGIAILESAFAEPHFGLGMLVEDLGRVYQDLGRYGIAKAQYEQGLELTKASFGEDHPKTAASHSNLGDLLREMDDVGSAVRHLEISVAILESQPKPDLPDLATSLGNLGAALRAVPDLHRAWDCCKRALEINLEEFGPDHLSVAYGFNNLGQILKDAAFFGRGHESQEQLDAWAGQAKEYFESALAIFAQVHSENGQVRPHPEIAMVLKNYGNLTNQQGNCPDARELLELALSIAERIYRRGHPFIEETLEDVSNLDC